MKTHHSAATRKKIGDAHRGRTPAIYRKDLPLEEVAALYASGLSSRQIAKRFGADKRIILARLKKAGIERRPPNRWYFEHLRTNPEHLKKLEEQLK